MKRLDSEMKYGIHINVNPHNHVILRYDKTEAQNVHNSNNNNKKPIRINARL